MTQQLEARAAETEPPSSRHSSGVEVERARLNAVAGAFHNPRNAILSFYSPSERVRRRIRQKIRSIITRSGFHPLRVMIQRYPGEDSGPGVVVTLAESTFVIGAWPKTAKSSLDFFFHFCSRDTSNDHKAKLAVDLFAEWLEASVEWSWHTPRGRSLMFITV